MPRERGGSPPPVIEDRYARPVGEFDAEAGNGRVLSDQALVRHFFEVYRGAEVHPIATDQFLNKSKDTYGSAWLGRELVQNFVDHNPQAPGTLDGVHVTREVIDKKKGLVRFVIRGDWPFRDPSGLMSPHSEKPKDMQTAGGNGIGLKQVAIRLLRDFQTQRFSIQGEGWTVDYHLAKAEDINHEWRERLAGQGQSPMHEVKHDWLLAEDKNTDEKGINTYTIETSDPELIAALDTLDEMGVSKENPFLQDLDFENKHGALKWLPYTPDAKEPPPSRLFINGQVMDYGKKSKEGWVGPEYVTVRLNNTKYTMSVDRPPVNKYELESYLKDLVGSMTKDELLRQLDASQQLWTQLPHNEYSWDAPGCFVVLEKIVETLRSKHRFSPADYAAHFGDKKYVHDESSLGEKDRKSLRQKEYIVCPSFFKNLGMPSASSKLERLDAAVLEKPDTFAARSRRAEIAEKVGIEVGFEELEGRVTPQMVGELLQRRLSSFKTSFERAGAHAYRIGIAVEIPQDLLSSPLFRMRTGHPEQALISFLRGVVYRCLKDRLCERAFTSQGEFVTTFSVDYDLATDMSSLIARNVESKSGGGFFVQFEFADEAAGNAFERAFTESKDAEEVVRVRRSITEQPSSHVVQSAPKRRKSILRKWAPRVALVGVAAFGGYRALRDEEPEKLATTQKLSDRPLDDESFDKPKEPPKVRPDLSQRDKDIFKKFEDKIHGLTKFVRELESAPGLQPSDSTEDALNQYRKWDQKGGAAGHAEGAGYMNGRTLSDLLDHVEQADVPSQVRKGETPEQQLGRLLQEAGSRIAPDHDFPDHFEITLQPTQQELAQLSLLRTYVHLTTGAAMRNRLFVFRGEGVKGLNFRNSIGLHEALFSVDFDEALETFAHEVAHNHDQGNGHGAEFARAFGAVYAAMLDEVSEVAEDAARGRPLDETDKVLLDIRKQWDALRTGVKKTKR